MSDGSIIRKTRVETEEECIERGLREDDWVFDVDNPVFTREQVDVLALGINAICKDKIAEMPAEFRAELDGIGGELDKLHDEMRTHRERVAMLEGQIKAMTDLKGVPGKQGERGARGEPGRQGLQGEKGGAGPPGAAAPHWIGVKIEGFDLITVLSDGTLGPRISLKQMFEEFVMGMARTRACGVRCANGDEGDKMKSVVITERNVAEFIRQVAQRAQRQLQETHVEHTKMMAELQRDFEADVAAMRTALAEVRAHGGKQASHTDSNETIGQPNFKQRTVVGVCARETTDDVIYQLMSQLQEPAMN